MWGNAAHERANVQEVTPEVETAYLCCCHSVTQSVLFSGNGRYGAPCPVVHPESSGACSPECP